MGLSRTPLLLALALPLVLLSVSVCACRSPLSLFYTPHPPFPPPPPPSPFKSLLAQQQGSLEDSQVYMALYIANVQYVFDTTLVSHACNAQPPTSRNGVVSHIFLPSREGELSKCEHAREASPTSRVASNLLSCLLGCRDH